jgi:hypothetical protein
MAFSSFLNHDHKESIMSDQRPDIPAESFQTPDAKKKYTPPKLTVLGKVDELTLGNETSNQCDAPFPGKGDLSCS